MVMYAIVTIYSTYIVMVTYCTGVTTEKQKLEREVRICKLLKHPNIGEYTLVTMFTGWLTLLLSSSLT